MYIPEFLTKPRNIMNGALAVLPSGLALFMFERVFKQSIWWLPWGIASVLTLILIGTMRVDELRPLYGYALIQISCFVLGFNRAWEWGLIPFVKSTALWSNIVALGELNINSYYLALLRVAVLSVAFIGINIYVSQEKASEEIRQDIVYVKKAGILNLDKYGFKTRLLLAFLTANAMLLLVEAAPSLLQANVYSLTMNISTIIQGVKTNLVAMNSLAEAVYSESVRMMSFFVEGLFGLLGFDNGVEAQSAAFLSWLVNDYLYLRYLLNLLVYGVIILFG